VKLASTIDLLRRLHGPSVVVRGYELIPSELQSGHG